MLSMLLDVGSVAGSTQLFLAALWNTRGPRRSRGSGSAGRTDGHMPQGKSFWETLLLGEPPMQEGLPEGKGAASLSQGASGQAVLARSSADPFLQDAGLPVGAPERQKADAALACMQEPRAWQGNPRAAMQRSLYAAFKPPSQIPTPKLPGQHLLLPPHP